jgi:hypothetical protein
MTTEPNFANARIMEDPEGPLESALIDEFLRVRGVDSSKLQSLPEEKARHLLAEASVYAATKLAEVEARAHFVHEIHGQE